MVTETTPPASGSRVGNPAARNTARFSGQRVGLELTDTDDLVSIVDDHEGFAPVVVDSDEGPNRLTAVGDLWHYPGARPGWTIEA